MSPQSNEELQARLAKLRAIDGQEVGGRAGDVAGLIEEILHLRKERDDAVRFARLQTRPPAD